MKIWTRDSQHQNTGLSNWVLINQPKHPKRPKNCRPKLLVQTRNWDFDEKGLH